MPVRGALIGCGFFSEHHLAAWRRMPRVEIVAACDLDLTKAQAAAPRAYTSVEEMLDAETLDFVDIVTRSTSHLELISKAAAKDLAVMCQKPMAPDWETGRLIVEVAAQRGIRLMIHDNWRWQSWYRAARALIAGGEIGVPLSYGFRCRLKDGLGDEPYPRQAYFRRLRRFLIDEVLVHHIDTARFLFGDVASIYAEVMRQNERILGEDWAVLTLRHENDVVGWIDGNRFVDHAEGMGLIASLGLDEAVFEGDAGSIRVSPLGEIWSGQRRIWTNDRTEGYRGDSVYATQAHFVECLENGKPFETEAREYFEKTFGVVEAAYASAASGRRVNFRDGV